MKHADDLEHRFGQAYAPRVNDEAPVCCHASLSGTTFTVLALALDRLGPEWREDFKDYLREKGEPILLAIISAYDRLSRRGA